MRFEEASRLLDRIAPGAHLWKKHSHQVAGVARAITEGLLDRGERLDLPWIRSCALLHDAGRSVTHGPLHGWTGYVLLRHEGAEDVSRGCIVHWLKGTTEEQLLAEGRLASGFVRELYRKFALPQLSLSDKVMALSDALVMHDRVVDLDRRFADLNRRYGASRWMERQLLFSKQYQEEIERLLKAPLAALVAPLAEKP